MVLVGDPARFEIQPVSYAPALKESVYEALKRAIMGMDIYGSSVPLKSVSYTHLTLPTILLV